MAHHDGFIQHQLFENGVPVDDTFARLIAAIDPTEFQSCFLEWMQDVYQVTKGEVIALDGKTLRGSYDRNDRQSALHLISAYASANQWVLGQLKTERKSNEVTAIPALIQLLELRGALVTIDAMGCQTQIAEAITHKGGDYLLAVKGNQSRLHQAIQVSFEPIRRASIDKKEWVLEKQKGRVESRTCYVLSAQALSGDFSSWNQLTSIVMVESFRAARGQRPELTYRYYISSADLTAERAGDAIREHWGIESMHWSLDVSLQEDACQIYRDHAAENLAGLRRMALNILKAEPTPISIPKKQKRCLMKPAFLERALLAGFESMVKK